MSAINSANNNKKSERVARRQASRGLSDDSDSLNKRVYTYAVQNWALLAKILGTLMLHYGIAFISILTIIFVIYSML